MPSPEISEIPLKVYWQPGCSSCLKAKEFLIEHGIEFQSINLSLIHISEPTRPY